MALQAVTAKLKWDGQQNPLVTVQGAYVPKIRQLLSGFQKFDGPPKRKLAIPILVPLWLRQQGILTQDAKYRAVGDMTIIAFFFLLRAGEYTYSPPKERKQTIPFTYHDIIY